MDDATKIIAVVRGAANAEIQEIFRELADQWRPDVQLVGFVAESHGLPDRHCQAGYLRNLATGARLSIFHDLGPGVMDCHLDGVRAVAVAATMQGDTTESGDLVLLNKFGKLEAAGGGLTSAFRAALAAGVPLLTSVSPAHDEAWRQFTQREFAILPADPAAIDLWRRVRSDEGVVGPISGLRIPQSERSTGWGADVPAELRTGPRWQHSLNFNLTAAA